MVVAGQRDTEKTRAGIQTSSPTRHGTGLGINGAKKHGERGGSGATAPTDPQVRAPRAATAAQGDAQVNEREGSIMSFLARVVCAIVAGYVLGYPLNCLEEEPTKSRAKFACAVIGYGAAVVVYFPGFSRMVCGLLARLALAILVISVVLWCLVALYLEF